MTIKPNINQLIAENQALRAQLKQADAMLGEVLISTASTGEGISDRRLTEKICVGERLF